MSEPSGREGDAPEPIGPSPTAPARRPEQARLGRLFLALSVRDFRFLWANNGLQALGASMEMIAWGWLVLEMTDSAFWVGATAGLRGLGHVGFSIFGGVIADRVDRRKTLVFMQSVVGLLALTVGLLVVTDRITLVAILSLTFVRGITAGVVLPLSNALIYDTVGGDRLLNAMAARLTAFNLARIVGSALAGALITSAGVGACFLVVGGVNLVAPATLLFMRGDFQGAGRSEPVLRNAADGLRYAWRSRPLRSLLTMSLLVEMFGFSHFVMLPVIARDVLHVGASGLGYLSAAGGAGSLVGTVGVASLGDFRRKGLLLGLAAGGAGLSLVLFATSSWYPLSLLLAALAGGTLMAYDPTMATVLQVLSTDAMRGRMMGLYALTFGFTPLGGFAAGIVATVLSAPIAIGLSGGVILAYVIPMFGRITRIEGGAEAVEAAPAERD